VHELCFISSNSSRRFTNPSSADIQSVHNIFCGIVKLMNLRGHWIHAQIAIFGRFFYFDQA
jgi:hypothetical protein